MAVIARGSSGSKKKKSARGSFRTYLAKVSKLQSSKGKVSDKELSFLTKKLTAASKASRSR